MGVRVIGTVLCVTQNAQSCCSLRARCAPGDIPDPTQHEAAHCACGNARYGGGGRYLAGAVAEGVGRGMKLGSKRRVRVPSRLPFACWRAATTTDRLKPMSTNPWVRGCSGSSEENAPTSGPGCAHAGMTDPCVCGMAGTLCAGLGCGAGPGGSGGEGRNSGASEVCRPGAIGTVGTDADDGRRASSGVSRSICTANVRSPLQRVSASNANASLKPIPTSSAIPVKVLAAVVARAANAAGMVVGGTTGSSSLGGGI